MLLFWGNSNNWEILKPLWEIQGESKPLSSRDGAYVVSFDPEYKVIKCFANSFDVANLAFIDGEFRKITFDFGDFEGGVEVCITNKDCKYEVEYSNENWTKIKETFQKTVSFLYLPTKYYKSKGFSWGDKVNVREGCGKDYEKKKVLYQLPLGAIVEVFEYRDGWYRINPSFGEPKYWPKSLSYNLENPVPQWVKEDYIKHFPPQERVPDKKDFQNRKEQLIAYSKDGFNKRFQRLLDLFPDSEKEKAKKFIFKEEDLKEVLSKLQKEISEAVSEEKLIALEIEATNTFKEMDEDLNNLKEKRALAISSANALRAKDKPTKPSDCENLEEVWSMPSNFLGRKIKIWVRVSSLSESVEKSEIPDIQKYSVIVADPETSKILSPLNLEVRCFKNWAKSIFEEKDKYSSVVITGYIYKESYGLYLEIHGLDWVH